MPTDPDAPPRHAGRHRQAGRLPGPLGLAVAVAVLLLAFGAGATVLRPSLAGGAPGADRNASTTGTSGGTGGFGTNLAATASPEVSPTSATPSPTAKATPTRKANTTPKRTPSRTPSKSTGTGSSGSGSSAQSADENKVVEITNQERAAAGCGKVTVNAKLASAARLHSQDQAEHNNMSHTGSDGSSPGTGPAAPATTMPSARTWPWGTAPPPRSWTAG
ncbi:hypothetical protein Prum_027300 [Phytohabitans rumicis]|uniref:SCP domain-containing protein n=1 Tax=Phytohabitans rumicis TaxID=1076125 RepID=A0A6V8L2C9_9ACTN|nr:hypothetical protein Prum_027300 [Phytohabitans rumicis]